MAEIKEKKQSILLLEPTEHFLIRAIQRKISDFSGLASLMSELCQAKVGEEVAIESNKTVVVAKRVKPGKAVLKTIYKRR